MLLYTDNDMYANVAQSVEQLIRNQQVAGSIPAVSSKICTVHNGVFYFHEVNIFIYSFDILDLKCYIVHIRS